MKKFLSLIGISTFLFLASCTRQVSAPSTNNTGGNNSNSTTVSGDFSITKFTDNNPFEDKTSDYAGFTFHFTEDGKVIAAKGGLTEQGSYTEKPSHEGEGAKLTLSFNTQPLSSLNKSWLIETITDSNINLKDDDAASNEVLQFSAL